MAMIFLLGMQVGGSRLGWCSRTPEAPCFLLLFRHRFRCSRAGRVSMAWLGRTPQPDCASSLRPIQRPVLLPGPQRAWDLLVLLAEGSEFRHHKQTPFCEHKMQIGKIGIPPFTRVERCGCDISLYSREVSTPHFVEVMDQHKQRNGAVRTAVSAQPRRSRRPRSRRYRYRLTRG